MNQGQFRKLSLFLIIFAILIILWGAWVRISGSGDGCGVHWPLCQGFIFPSGEYLLTLQTWIEYFHRAKSGLFGILVILQCVYAYILFAKGTAVRFFSVCSLIFTLIEALLGAALVLGSFVDSDTSLGRVFIMSLHLVNTLILLFVLTGTYYYSKTNNIYLSTKVVIAGIRSQKHLLLAALIIILIAITGAWAALSTTLFPSSSLMEGLQKDLSGSSHIILRLRMFHPILAILASFGVFFLADKSVDKKLVPILSLLLCAQVLFGTSTLFFLSPTWMKLGHLFIADLLWITLCLAVLVNCSVQDVRDSN